MKSNFIAYASELPGILIPVILVAVFGIVVLVVILVKKHVKAFKDEEEPKSEKEIAAENLDRLLQPIEDPEQSSQFEEYDKKQNDEEK